MHTVNVGSFVFVSPLMPGIALMLTAYTAAVMVPSALKVLQLPPALPWRAAVRLMATAGDSGESASPALDMSLLSERIERVRASEAGEESEVALLVLDAMLPRQRLVAELEKPLVQLLRSLHGEPVVVCGLERGLRMPRPLRVGVATTVHLPDPLQPQAGLTVSFVGGRMCEILSLLDRDATFGLGCPVFTARVRWLGLRRQGSDPESFASEAEASGLHERAAALLKRAEEWIDLVRRSGRERCAGQMDLVSRGLKYSLSTPAPHMGTRHRHAARSIAVRMMPAPPHRATADPAAAHPVRCPSPVSLSPRW